jgi:hypothetical protein
MFIREEIEYGNRTAHTTMDLYDYVQEEDLKQVCDHHSLIHLQRRHAQREGWPHASHRDERREAMAC